MSRAFALLRVFGVLSLAILISAAGIVPASASPVPADTAEAGGQHCTRPTSTGDITVNVTFAGSTYPVLVYVPAGVSKHRSLPLVLNLHGSNSNGASQMDISDLRAVAEKKKFVVAAPNGDIPLPSQQTPPDPNGSWAWNVPGVPTTAGQFPPPTARDDVAYLSRVIDTVSEQLCTDDDRTYATGYSGGARMASALGCRISTKLAAIAPVAGVRAGRADPANPTVPEAADCTPQVPVPVIAFHGQQDPVNPYEGRPTDLRWGYSVPVAVQTWAQINGCGTSGKTTVISEHVTRLRYQRCDDRADVELYTVSDGGHTWPGSPVTSPFPPQPTQEIEAAEIMWSFFAKHHR